MATPTNPGAIAIMRREMHKLIAATMETRIMSPPRRPRGEKPRTTIRYLQRQIRNMQNIILDLRTLCDDKDKQIARQDVELSEAADREQILITQVENSASQHGALLATQNINASRLAFLEGYYAKSTEAFRGSGAGHPGASENGAQSGEEGRQQTDAGRFSGGPRKEIRRFHPDDPAFDYRR